MQRPTGSIMTKKAPWMFGILALLSLGITFFPVSATPALPMDRHIHLTAGNFAFQPGVVRVNPGDRITLKLAATDVVHGLYLDGYDLTLIADPGQTANLTFVADQMGTFRFRCSVTCGPLHPFMTGKLVVGSNVLFWRTLALAGVFTVAALFVRFPEPSFPNPEP
jgi:heme/copper-type cytochrome/quinol oxidase subunit 2